MRYSISKNYENLSMNGKNIFHWGKWNEPIENSTNTTERLAKMP